MPESGKVNRGIISIDGDSVIALEERLNISREENPGSPSGDFFFTIYIHTHRSILSDGL